MSAGVSAPSTVHLCLTWPQCASSVRAPHPFTMFCRATHLTSAHSGNRVSVLVCLLILVLNLFSFLHLSSISSTHALEEDEYSVTSLLPSFKTLMFWRTEEKKVGEPIHPLPKLEMKQVHTPLTWWQSGADAKQRPSDKDNRICHSCGENSVLVNEKEEYRQRIEFIKEQILTRLGMKRPPRLRPDIDLSLCNSERTLPSHSTNSIDSIVLI